MNLSRMNALAVRIIRQILRDKRTLALIFVVPIVIMSLLSLVLSSTSVSHTLAIVRPTGTGSAQGNRLLDSLLPAKEKLAVIAISADQVDSTLKDGKADAALIFPSDFMQQAASGQQPVIRIVLEGSDPTVASVMRDQSAALVRQFGVALAAFQANPTQLPGSGATLPLTVAEPRYIYGGSQYTFNDSIAPVFIGIFSFFFVFLLTSVAFLRERSQGTIERVLVSPLRRTELVIGYVFGFTLFALVQSLVTLLFVIFILRVHYSGNVALVFLISALLTIGSVNLGIFLSTFARNEFQIIQFIPLIFGVQIFLSGVFWPIDQLPSALRPISYLLPLTYANEALRGVMLKGNDFFAIGGQLTGLLVFAVLMVLLSALTMRRQIE